MAGSWRSTSPDSTELMEPSAQCGSLRDQGPLTRFTESRGGNKLDCGGFCRAYSRYARRLYGFE
ncbi:hypothetical protein SBRY_50492 [Actinacidiphila bryophytorum]|uniref:Uncharacterized protein n=1 Tax=Actinacidiphila bryophytorum TaxID=1436133 RepID=A0A9W4H4K6_9ACTN|nr:hypothetical protein SBRY_50492 [Actinacidiphila bryophytorum]